MISIIVANWWAKDWVDILCKSIKNTMSTKDYEIIIIDNSKELNEKNIKEECIPNALAKLRVIKPEKNLGHGQGVNFGIWQAKGDYIFIVDVDAFFLLKDWDKLILDYFIKNKLKLIACRGGSLKPIRPCGMFFERDWYINNQMDFKAQHFNGVKFDVGIHFYFKTLSLTEGKDVEFFPYMKTKFEDVCGSEYIFGGNRFLYHNYYSTRWFNIKGVRVHERIGSMDWDKFKRSKNNLFKQINK